MEPETTTPELLPEEPQLSSAGNEGAVSTSSEPKEDALTLAELNAMFPGKNFKDKASALKSIQDTYSYVGKRKEDILKEASTNAQDVSKELKEIKENLFFKDNPEFLPYKDAYKKVGGNPEDFFNAPEFKPLFEKAKGYDETQKLKSVLVSNPRLAASKDNLTKAVDASNAGSYEDAAKLATQAVLESLQ